MRLRKILKIGVGIVFVGILGIQATTLINKSALFEIDCVKLSGFSPSLEEFVRKKVVGKNIFSLDLKNLKFNIEIKFPKIKVINITKLLPSCVYVEYQPKDILFQFSNSQCYYLVSEDFKIVDKVKYGPHPSFPIVEDIYLPSKSQQKFLRDFFEAIKKAGFPYRIKVIRNVRYPENFYFLIEKNVKIIIGYKDLYNKIKRCMDILSQIEPQDIKYIDLRLEGFPRIVFKK